jgi:hypothetical protein
VTESGNLPLTSTSVHYWTQRLFEDGHWHTMPGYSTTNLEHATQDFEVLRATSWQLRVIKETRVITTEVLDV